jgi:hypothetical protein
LKTIITTVVGVAALVCVATALAAAPQGHLTGSAAVSGVATTQFHITNIAITQDVVDGEQTFVHANNDSSGDCDGDAGQITTTYDDASQAPHTILCAHFDGNNGMSVDWSDDHIGAFVVIRIRDRTASRQTDVLTIGSTNTQNSARDWVNLGTTGSGHSATPLQQATVTGDYTITP